MFQMGKTSGAGADPFITKSMLFFARLEEDVEAYVSSYLYINKTKQRGERKQNYLKIAHSKQTIGRVFCMDLISSFLKRPRHKYRYGGGGLILEVCSFSARTKIVLNKSTTMGHPKGNNLSRSRKLAQLSISLCFPNHCKNALVHLLAVEGS